MSIKACKRREINRLACQCVGNSPRVFQMLIPSTSESALALGPPRVLHPLPYNQIPPNSNQQHPHRQGLETNQTRDQLNLPHTAHVVSLPQQKASCSPLKGSPRAYSLGDERGVHCKIYRTSPTESRFSKIKKR